METNIVKLSDLVSPEGEVNLIFDYELGEAGKVRSVELTYMTGTAEEAFSKDKIAKSIGKMATELLTHVIAKVEGKVLSDSNRRELVKNMYTVDRDLLLLASYYISFGETMQFDDRCPNCGSAVQVVGNVLDLEATLPVNVKHTIEVPLFHGVKYADGHHKVAVIARPTGAVQEAITTAEIMKNPVAMKNALLLRMIKRLGDLSAIPAHVIESQLSVKDKNLIFKASNDFEGSISTSFPCTCQSCEEQFQVAVPMEKYFMGE